MKYLLKFSKKNINLFSTIIVVFSEYKLGDLNWKLSVKWQEFSTVGKSHIFILKLHFSSKRVAHCSLYYLDFLLRGEYLS